jgi:hypothetical protein
MPYYSQYKHVFPATFYTQRLIDFVTYIKLWLDSRQGPEFFLFFQNVQTGSEVHPAIYSVVNKDSLPDQKLARTLRRPVNPCSVEVKNEWSHNSTTLHTSKNWTDKILLFTLYYIKGIYNDCSTQVQVHFLGRARWVCLRKTESGEVLMWFPSGNQHSSNPY